MALTERPSPVEVKESFLNILTLPGPAPPGPAPPAPPPVVITLPVFVLGLRNLARGAVTEGAKQAGWQCLTVGPDGVYVSGDVTHPGPGGAPPAASRSRGPTSKKVHEAYDALKKLKEVQNVNINYEPRALRIPALHIEALWLRKQPFSDQLDQDLVVPFHTFNADLAAQLFFSMPDFMAIVRPLAVQQLKVVRPRD